MLSPARTLLAEPAGMFNRGIFGGGAHIPFPHLKTTIVTNQDDDDGGACFYPSDFPPTPAGVCNSPGGLDESFGIEAYLSGTDENQMDQEPAVEEGGHGQNYGDDFVPMLSTSMVTSVKTEPELLQVVPGLLGPSRRPSLPSSHSSTSLVTQASDHDLCNENEASPNIVSSCECGDPQCTEASSALANVSTSFMGNRSLTRFSREPSSRGQSVAHSGGTSQSEVFSTITAEEACTRQGLECEFVMELEDPQPSMEDESLAFADYYQQQQQEGLLPASSKPVSPLISRMLGDTDMIDPTKLPSTATQSADGLGLWYSSGGGRPPARSALRPRRNSADKQYAFDRRARYGVLGCKSAEAMKQEAEPGRGNPKEPAIPDYLRSKPLSKSKAPALRYSRSEPALLRGTRSVSLHPEGVKTLPRPGYGGCYGTGMIPTTSMLPSRSSQSSVELASCSASSQVRAQIQTYTQSKASHREENSNSPTSAGLRLDPRSLHLTSSSSSGLSASALISRAAAGMNIPGCSSDTSSIGMGFSKLATAAAAAAAAAASANLQTSQQQQRQQQHQQQHQQQQQVDGGLRLVQILVNCAEAVACRDSRQASSLLQTLQRLASPYGDAMQRVAACFLDGLSVRIYSSPAGFKSSGNSAAMAAVPPARMRAGPSDRERHEGFSLLCQSCPYVGFGHYTANTAMMEAFAGEDALHVIDLGMSHGLQWPGLIRSLASRAGGKPRSLRITGVGLNAAKMAEAGEQLDRVAREADLAFTFRIVKESLENLDRTMLDLRDGEALAVNSVLQLHCVVKESRGSLNAVLQSIHDLSPKILTLVEQDASHNGPFFMGRFVEALHYYSAIFDSLDATLPRYSTQRVKIEQFHYAEEIRNIVSCEGPARVERHERIDQWRRRMSRAGFQPQPLKFLHDTRRWLASYDCPGYTLAEEKGCLVLGWNSKPIIAASSWRC